jgi:ATP-binding cassette subfamily C protein
MVSLFRKAFGAYYAQIALILFFTVMSSASEGIGISAVVPAFSFIAGGSPTDAISVFLKHFFLFFHIPFTFRTLLLFIAVLFVVRTVLLFFVQIITARIVFGYQRDIRKRLFSLTMRAGWPYLSKQKLGHLSQLLMSNASTAAGFFTNFSIITIIATKTIAYLFVSVNVSPFIALFAVIAGGGALFLFKPIFAKGKNYSVLGERLGRDASHFVNQHISGMKTVKTMDIEEPVEKKAEDYFEQMRISSVAHFTIRGVLQMTIALGGLVFVGIAFAIMYHLPGFQLATFGVIVYALNQIFTQIQLVQGQLHTAGSVLPYLSSLTEYEDEVSRNAEPRTNLLSAPPVLSSGIEFSHVSFAYTGRSQVLHDVDFSIPRGAMVGIIGPSGTGKTTVADLLMRLYEPTSGTIRVDGKPLQDIPLSAWRRSIGYVTQDIFLLNDTLANNISFYEPLSRKEVVAAAKLANIDEFIESLPQGYDTLVGDRGVLLSGGQRQRVVLARILARKPALLILDEATSSLDSESERAIQSTIEGLHGQVTTLIIAHRLSTVVNADTIIAFEGGTIIESGTPGELLKNPNSYFGKMSLP